MARLKLGVLISGRGTNLAALIDACAQSTYPATIALVISNHKDAEGLEKAEAAHLPSLVIEHAKYPERTAFDAALSNALEQAGVQLICLAGFMRLLGTEFVNRWAGRIINIHPSLLPAFRGLNVHERTVAAGVKISGCTVHFVRPEVDDGPIIIQAAVPVLPNDDAKRLAARILTAEHQIYPEAVRLIATGEARLMGDKVVLSTGDEMASLINPPIKSD